MVLAVICLAQFVFILDVSVVNVALVPLETDLRVDAATLPLVAAVYAATFGGVLLLGGRLADRGRARQVFIAGLTLFAVSSAVCGAAWDPTVLVVGRAAQGAGAGLASPAALALLTTRYAEGPARDRALSVWAAVAAAGGAVGLVLGGLLTTGLGWRSVFFVNVPLVAVIVLAARAVITADRPGGSVSMTGVWSSAALAGGGIVALVLGLSVLQAGQPGAAAVLALGVVLLVVHRLRDRRSPQPLLAPVLIRNRVVVAADIVTAALSAVVLGVNFFLTLSLQGRLGLGPLTTGLAFLPITVVSAVTALGAARLVGRIGPARLLAAGMGSMAVGTVLLAVFATGGYPTVLPGMVLVAAGMGPGFAVGSIAATNGVPAEAQGAAGALLSTATQVGAAIGLAVFSVLAGAADDPIPGDRIGYAAMTVTAVAAGLVALGMRISTRPGRVASLPAHAAGCLPGCAAPSPVEPPVEPEKGLRS